MATHSREKYRLRYPPESSLIVTSHA